MPQGLAYVLGGYPLHESQVLNAGSGVHCQLRGPPVELAAQCLIMVTPFAYTSFFSVFTPVPTGFPVPHTCRSNVQALAAGLWLSICFSLSFSFEFLYQILLRKIVWDWQLILCKNLFINQHWTTLVSALWEGMGQGLFYLA